MGNTDNPRSKNSMNDWQEVKPMVNMDDFKNLQQFVYQRMGSLQSPKNRGIVLTPKNEYSPCRNCIQKGGNCKVTVTCSA